MTGFFRLLTVICGLMLSPGLSSAEEPLVIFAAASLKMALDEVVDGYDKPVVVSYGGSGALARQVALGAPADVVFLANGDWMNWLESNRSIDAAKRLDLLGNRLVLIGPRGAAPMAEITTRTLLDRLAGGRLAVGHLQSVPAGIYARQWLENAGFLTELRPHLAESDNVRAALMLVAHKETPLGVVYATDVGVGDDVVVLYEIPDDLHDPVIYPVALVSKESTTSALHLLTYLRSRAASTMFQSHGFHLLEAE